MVDDKKKKSDKRGLSANEQAQIIALTSAMVARSEIMSYLGKSYSGDRDLYEALGYKKTLVFQDYNQRYTRQDIAKRIIDLPAKTVWRKRPKIVESGRKEEKESAFEKGWTELVREKRVFHYLSRIDRISGIGQYGVLLMGFDDNKELREPLEKGIKRLTYLMPFSEDNAKISKWETNAKDERYGLPVSYTLSLNAPGMSGMSGNIVHHSRVIHVAEELRENNVYGTPRLEAVYNRLQDTELVSGGSAEMFWRGAFPGFLFKLAKEADINTLPLADIKDQIDEYMHGLKRYMRLQGIDADEFKPQVADPSKHISIYLDLICATSGIPKRIFMGSERGELASSQDEKNWNDAVDERRRNHAEPMILRPFIDKMIDVKILPEPKKGYDVEWPALQIPNEKEEAEVARTYMTALKEYTMAIGADQIVPPEFMLEKFLKLSKEEIEKIGEIVKKMIKEDQEEEIEE